MSKYSEYDINQYTDDELIQFLGLNHPTDRELEAKIIMMINKYSNIQKEDAYRIAIFYQNIYKRFFDIEEGEETIFEGFGNYEEQQYAKTINTKQPVNTITPGPRVNAKNVVNDSSIDLNANVEYIDNGGTVSKTEPTDLTTLGEKYNLDPKIVSTQLFDYSKNPSGTNPLLKQTIKRIISIDSQFRDRQFQPISTDFTFNLSEPLKDVVSLKLYSINIPYTWYTISKAYGANLIYLKGNSPGITNGLHDYQIAIAPGNYTPSDFISAINTEIVNLTKTYTDISFGETNISYDSVSTKMTFTTNIQKVYTESNYKITFSNQDMSGFLGFNNFTYTLNKIYSMPSTTTLLSYKIDSSNNYFTIYRYIPTTKSSSTNYRYNGIPIQSYKITLCDYDGREITSGNFTSGTIATYVKYGLQNNINLLSTSGLEKNQSIWELTIDLDRNYLNPTKQPNEKIAVIFPDINIDNINLWLNKPEPIKSVFNFYNNNNCDTNVLISEKTVILNQITISNSYISFKCIRPNYITNANDASFNYSITNRYIKDYYNIVNNTISSSQINGIIFTDVNMSNTYKDTYSYLQFNFQFSKQFTTQYYSMIIDSKKLNNTISILYKYYGFLQDQIYDLSQNTSTNSINTSYIYNYQNITDIISNRNYYLFTFFPNNYSKEKNVGNQYDISYDVWYVPPANYNNIYQYYDLLSAIQNQNNIYIADANGNVINKYFNKNILNINIKPENFTNKSVTYNINTTFNITNTITQDDYELDFSSNYIYIPVTNNGKQQVPSSESNQINVLSYFGLDLSYSIVNLSQNNNSRYIIGKYNLTSNTFINKSGVPNTITFTPASKLSGIELASQNTFTITIPDNTYDINTLINYINSQLILQINPNSSMLNSFIDLITFNGFNYIILYSNINVVYTTKDYKLVFFDPYNFIKCVATANSISNATWDTTLGWTLGFRDFVDYELTRTNVVPNPNQGAHNYPYYLTSKGGNYTYNSTIDNLSGLETYTITTLTGDTSTTTNIYNYFLIILDDFIQNHLNDGLVTISKPETQLPAQSYASMANKVCDPTTGQIVSLSTSNIPGNNLTQKQLYALNAIQIADNINYNINYSKGPYVQDIFGIVPIKPGTNGQTYVEFGGTLQNQERQYFGPVNIRRMGIQLVNDKGDIVDLNNSEWSFSLICEQLYNSTSSKS